MQRIKLTPDVPSESRLHLDVITKAVAKAKRCVIITGAGISVSAGIPVS